MFTPRSSTADDGLMRADSNGSPVVVNLASCCRVPSHTSCVLSVFILSLLLRIQASMRSTQAMKRCVENLKPTRMRLEHWCTPVCRRRTSVRRVPHSRWCRTTQRCTTETATGRGQSLVERWRAARRLPTAARCSRPAGCDRAGTTAATLECLVLLSKVLQTATLEHFYAEQMQKECNSTISILIYRKSLCNKPATVL